MRTGLHFVVGLAFAICLAGAGTAYANQQQAEAALPQELKPGHYVWQPERASSGPVEIVVSLSQQLVYVFRSGEPIGLASISSGTELDPTPVGRFRILQKKRTHFSSKYDNAPMPYMLRLTWYGLALHGGHNPGYPASHGCIRLPLKFAEKLFAAAALGATVLITDDAPNEPGEALALLRDYVPPSEPVRDVALESASPAGAP